MEQTSKALFAGVLSIISGVSGLIGGVFLALLAALGAGALGATGDAEAQAFWFVPAAFFGPLALLCLVTGGLAVAGGVAAVQRQRWALALVGSIAAVFSCFFLGLPAVILLILSEQEFRRPAVPVMPTPS